MTWPHIEFEPDASVAKALRYRARSPVARLAESRRQDARYTMLIRSALVAAKRGRISRKKVMDHSGDALPYLGSNMGRKSQAVALWRDKVLASGGRVAIMGRGGHICVITPIGWKRP